MTPATLRFVIMSIIKHCQRAEHQRMKRSRSNDERRTEEERRETGLF